MAQSLSILPTGDAAVSFAGSLDMNAVFSFSSIDSWVYNGNYLASLSGEIEEGGAAANLTLTAFDDDFFDDKPRKCYDV